jgi:hypothetical protein
MRSLLNRGNRHEDDIVLILTRSRKSLRTKNASDLARENLSTDRFPYGVLNSEEVIHYMARHTNWSGGLHVRLGKKKPSRMGHLRISVKSGETPLN